MIQPLRVGGKRQLDHRLFGGGDLSGDCTLFAFSIANLASRSYLDITLWYRGERDAPVSSRAEMSGSKGGCGVNTLQLQSLVP